MAAVLPAWLGLQLPEILKDLYTHDLLVLAQSCLVRMSRWIEAVLHQMHEPGSPDHWHQNQRILLRSPISHHMPAIAQQAGQAAPLGERASQKGVRKGGREKERGGGGGVGAPEIGRNCCTEGIAILGWKLITLCIVARWAAK